MNNPGLIEYQEQLLKCFKTDPKITGLALCKMIDNILKHPRDNDVVRVLIDALQPCASKETDSKLYDMNGREIVTLEDEIGVGSYADIFGCSYNGQSAVLKVPLLSHIDDADYGTDAVIIDFAREAVINIVLHFLQARAHQCYDISPQYTTIPTPYLLLKEASTGVPTTLVYIYERLDYTMAQILPPLAPRYGLILCLQFVLAVYYMQMAFGNFTHFNSTLTNIMVKKYPKPVMFTVTLHDNFKFTVPIEYGVYFIDFNLSCLEVTKCIEFTQLPAARYGADWKDCSDKALDLHMFFKDITEMQPPLHKDIVAFATEQNNQPHTELTPYTVIKRLVKVLKLV